MRFDTQLSLASACLSGALAVAVLVRTRGRAIADWACALGFVALGAEEIFGGLARESDILGIVLQWQTWRLLALALMPGLWLLFSLSFARGNAREFLRSWRFTLATAFVLPISVATAFRSDLFIPAPLPESVMAHSILAFGWAGLALYLAILAGSVLVLMNLERTFRASVGTMRWRIKFMLMGIGLLFVVRIYTCTQALLFLGVDRSLGSLDQAALWVAAILILRSLFRERQSSPDIYPSHMVLQGSFTVLLVGAYLLIVGSFAKVVAHLGGDASFALKAFVVMVLLVLAAVVLQSERIRLRFRRFLNRNFSRPSHDYRAVWRNFTEGTAFTVEQAGLCRALARLVAQTFQSLSVSVWLVDDNRENLVLAASTFLSEGEERARIPAGRVREMLRHFQSEPEPVDLDEKSADWSELLKEIHPRKFPSGDGHRICIPLVNSGDVLGFITVGDRVSAAAFSTEDFDMLACVGGHASASILNAQLSHKLLSVKEMEAFQTMAAFFVHDLKNAASTLNLMLQNLPTHFDDPAFREDALRGVGKTVSHINHLVSRLTSLRHEVKVQTANVDFNAMVTAAITGAVGAANSQVVSEFAPVGEVRLDREQMAKVITNLVLNAIEATPGNAPVHVSTSQDDSWVILSVTDKGCGMSADFLGRSLFRPFQTTKKNGLGIGMFQSKMIVDGHAGRIAVSSEVGRGTTFQVFLPKLAPIS